MAHLVLLSALRTGVGSRYGTRYGSAHPDSRGARPRRGRYALLRRSSSVSKSRSFSIYLLKEGFDATTALKPDHVLDGDVAAANLPSGASLFVLDAPPKPPWWKDYFGVDKALHQTGKGALVFLPINGRTFVLTFGRVAHNLKDESYEYDFGLRVTLNAVDPKRLKNTDVIEPGTARRQRTQVAIDSDLTYFEFDRDSKILKSLTGKAKPQYRHLMKHATGSTNLRINSPVGAADLAGLCTQLLALYRDESYRTTFPDIHNITPVRDPSLIAALDARLLEAIQTKNPDLYLTVPTIVDYQDEFYVAFGGAGASRIYDEVYLDRYYEYLAEKGRDPSALALGDLRSHVLKLTNEDGDPRSSYSLYRWGMSRRLLN